MKKILYTIVSGDYDTLKDPEVQQFDWQYVCFTDNPNLKSDVWDIELVELDKRLSRKHKILNPFPEYDITVYIDASFRPVRHLDNFVILRRNGIWLNAHPQRDCAYKEAQIVIDKNLDTKETLVQQIQKYEHEGFPKDYGLYRCGIMIREPRETANLMETWWKEIEQGSWRDQVSFPYACWKTGTKPNIIKPGVTTGYFKQSLHNPKPLGDFEISHFANCELVENNTSNCELVENNTSNAEINRKISAQPAENWILVGGNPGKDPKQIILNNPYTHLFITDNTLLFPRWLHDYIQIDLTNKRRWDLQFKHIVEVYEGIIRPI